MASWVSYASGIRNPVGLTFQPGTGTLFATGQSSMSAMAWATSCHLTISPA